MDHLRDTHDFMAVGIRQWLYDWWVYSYSSGYRHCRGTHPNHPGKKPAVTIWIILTLKEGGSFG